MNVNISHSPWNGFAAKLLLGMQTDLSDPLKTYVGPIVKTSSTEIWQEIEPGHVIVHSLAEMGKLSFDQAEPVTKLNGMLVSIRYQESIGQRVQPARLTDIDDDIEISGEIVSQTSSKYIQFIGYCLGSFEYVAHEKNKVGELTLNCFYDIKYEKSKVYVFEII